MTPNSKDSFSYQFRKYQETMLKFATRLTRCEAKAQDLVQEAAIKAFKHQEKLDNFDKFKSWFSTILYNTFINDYRKKARRRDLLEGTQGILSHFFNQSKTYNQGFEQLKADDVENLSKNVGPNSYATFQLYTQGYSYKEISAQLDIAIGTVKSRIHFARNRMKTVTRSHQIVA